MTRTAKHINSHSEIKKEFTASWRAGVSQDVLDSDILILLERARIIADVLSRYLVNSDGSLRADSPGSSSTRRDCLVIEPRGYCCCKSHFLRRICLNRVLTREVFLTDT